MPDIFTEVDEDLRKEKLERAWKKYGPLLIAGVVLFIAAMAGQVLWENYREGQRAEQSDRYAAAVGLIEQGSTQQGLAALDAVIAEGEAGYRLLARLQKASTLAREGRPAEAIGEYQALAADGEVERRYRDYATLMAASLMMDQPGAGDAGAMLEGLTGPGNPWRFSARELLGLWHLEQGNAREAERIYTALLNADDAPRGVRGRAQEMLGMIGSAAPEPLTPPTAGEGEPLAPGTPDVAQEESPASEQ